MIGCTAQDSAKMGASGRKRSKCSPRLSERRSCSSTRTFSPGCGAARGDTQGVGGKPACVRGTEGVATISQGRHSGRPLHCRASDERNGPSWGSARQEGQDHDPRRDG